MMHRHRPQAARQFPLTISQPGSYILVGNITVPDANTTAISVQADYVTIDLNGFSIQGPVVCSGQPTTCSPSGSGIGIDATSHVGTTVRNGVVRGMGGSGLFDGPSEPFMRVANVSAVSNGNTGINQADTVTNCTAFANGNEGIHAVTVTASTANKNTSRGIFANTVTGCVAFSKRRRRHRRRDGDEQHL